MQFDNVAIGDDVAGSYLLTLEAGRSPHACVFEGPCEILVDQACNIRHCSAATQRVRSGTICSFPGRLGIDAHDAQMVEEPRAYFTKPLTAGC